MSELRRQIEDIWAARESLDAEDDAANSAIHAAIDLLDAGEARVAEPDGEGGVLVNEWLKLAILLLFRQAQMSTIEVGPFEFADKIPLKTDYAARGVRVVPGASARWGSYQGPGVIMMPSYINIGAYVGANTMVDTWATVGSCAQIGNNVHLSGGVGIGGVLEPPNAVRCRGRRLPDRKSLHRGRGRPCRRRRGPGCGRGPYGFYPRDRRRNRRRVEQGRGAIVVCRRSGQPGPRLRRRPVRPAVCARHQAPGSR